MDRASPASAPPAEGTVLHTMQRWLPLSEQFVHALVAGSRHRAVVASRLRTENREVFPHRPVFDLGRWHPPAWLPASLERRGLTAALAAIALAYRAKIVHHHHGYRLHEVEGAVRRLGLPLVVSAHGQDVTTHARTWPSDLGAGFAIAAAVIVPSAFLAPYVEALGTPRERIAVIPSGVDVAWFSPTPLPDTTSPEIVFLGRFVEKKGLDVLLKAWPAVRSGVPGAELRLVGFGSMEPLARSGGPGVTVELADPDRRAEQAREAIRRASVVVTPSRTASDGDAETLLLVNLEAQASGRPLVTTRHGGIPEYVREGETALVVPENDPDALADALIRVLRDRALAARLAAAGPGWAARFTVRDCVARVDALYDSIVRGEPIAR